MNRVPYNQDDRDQNSRNRSNNTHNRHIRSSGDSSQHSRNRSSDTYDNVLPSDVGDGPMETVHIVSPAVWTAMTASNHGTWSTYSTNGGSRTSDEHPQHNHKNLHQSIEHRNRQLPPQYNHKNLHQSIEHISRQLPPQYNHCLLYTSDAADE